MIYKKAVCNSYNMEACQLYIICKFTAGSTVEGRLLPTAATIQWDCRPAFVQEKRFIEFNVVTSIKLKLIAAILTGIHILHRLKKNREIIFKFDKFVIIKIIIILIQKNLSSCRIYSTKQVLHTVINRNFGGSWSWHKSIPSSVAFFIYINRSLL